MKLTEDVPEQCLNCDADAALGQVYCGICGQKYVTERLTLHEIGHDLLHAFIHVDRSALSLVYMLLVRPGTVAGIMSKESASATSGRSAFWW